MSNCIPSTVSKVVSKDLASSTVMTPVSPTFAIAGAINLPISSSPAEIDATCEISSLDSIFLALSLKISIASFAASSIPFFKKTGFAPALNIFNPSLTIACAKIVAVVVPSPATSFDLIATSLTRAAPIFSNGSSNSISFAIVTPSLVIKGAP